MEPILVPSRERAWIIRFESLESSGSRSSLFCAARAESTSSRFVRDFDPGRLIVEDIGELALGAGQLGE